MDSCEKYTFTASIGIKMVSSSRSIANEMHSIN